MGNLEDEVIQLIAAYRTYQVTHRGLYFIEQRIDRVIDLLARDPGNIELMRQLGLSVDSNGQKPRR